MARIRIPVLLAALAAAGWLSARPAAAQDPARYARAKAALTPQAAAQFEAAVTAAKARGIPVDPLVDKALEGVAKRIAPDRIVAVVRARADQLGRAQALLRAGAMTPAPADVTAVADALQRGVPESAVLQLRAGARAGEPIALAVHTLADLIQRGVPVDVALDVLSAWRARGADPAELRELPAAVERLIRQGVLPAQAAASVAATLRAGRGPGTLVPGALVPGRGRSPLPPGVGPPVGVEAKKDRKRGGRP